MLSYVLTALLAMPIYGHDVLTKLNINIPKGNSVHMGANRTCIAVDTGIYEVKNVFTKTSDIGGKSFEFAMSESCDTVLLTDGTVRTLSGSTWSDFLKLNVTSCNRPFISNDGKKFFCDNKRFTNNGQSDWNVQGLLMSVSGDGEKALSFDQGKVLYTNQAGKLLCSFNMTIDTHVDVSADGSTVAISHPLADINGTTYIGYIDTYDYNNTECTFRANVTGVNDFDKMGSTIVQLSANGKRLLVNSGGSLLLWEYSLDGSPQLDSIPYKTWGRVHTDQPTNMTTYGELSSNGGNILTIHSETKVVSLFADVVGSNTVGTTNPTRSPVVQQASDTTNTAFIALYTAMVILYLMVIGAVVWLTRQQARLPARPPAWY